MNYKFRTSGVCSSMIEFDLNDGIVSNVKYTGGCNGNLKGISAMAEGMKAEDVIQRLEGIKCGFKNTSCPDQFAKALRTALAQE
ncbi:MAG: TIGR03905 family TSCPD domain-containing protein [Ruminococcaceae bacterium]|nr:TIGR03905 family TSCPD domain-containing protein [Oscillospiraceae bacterium]